MSPQPRHLLDSIRAKALIISQRYTSLMEQKRLADAEVARLRAEVAGLKAAAERDRQELIMLRLTAANASAEDRQRLRNILEGLLRDIDKCIDDLSL